jgi:PAS domain S-box-containing protein
MPAPNPQSLFALCPDPLAVVGTDGRFRLVNPAFSRTLGWSEEELNDTSLTTLLHPDDRESMEQVPARLRSGQLLFRADNRVRHKDGRYKRLSWRAAGVPEDDLLYLSAREVEDDAPGHPQPQESEQRFKDLAEAMPQLVWMAEADGTVTYYNSRAEQFHGFHRRPDGTWEWQMVLHPDDVELTVNAWSKAIATSHVYQCEHRTLMASGTYRWHLSRAYRSRRSDGTVQWFGTATDIHEVKLAQEALRAADRRKDEFLAMLGHELRNPLAAIRSATDVVKFVESDDPRLQRAIGVLERQSNQMSRLIDGLLEVSRIARGKVVLDQHKLDLRALLTITLDDLSGSFVPGIDLVRRLPATPLWVLADQVRLTQVFDNLLGNALKFTQPAGRIEVIAEQQASEAVVTIRDSGIGIRPEMLEEIFEPFHQEAQHETPGGGLGLGLALARGLVELHHGNLTARSEGLGHGSEFVVRLPLTVGSEPEPERAQMPPRSHHRILIIEDNTDAATMLGYLLEAQGHQVELVASGQEGLEILAERPIDVVLCDIGLPGMSGLEFARAVRADPALHNILLVATTGYGQPEDIRRSTSAGFDEHLVKPIDLDALADLLQRRA